MRWSTAVGLIMGIALLAGCGPSDRTEEPLPNRESQREQVSEAGTASLASYGSAIKEKESSPGAEESFENAPAAQQLPVVSAPKSPLHEEAPSRPGAELPSSVYERESGWREERVQALREEAKREAIETARRAKELGLALRIEGPDGKVRELSHFEGDKPVYRETRNANAAISTGVDLIRDAAPFVDGSGLTVGVWDGGSVRVTHQEFGNRVTATDGASSDDHATHVGGTIAAGGFDAEALGMAPAAEVASYDWNADRSEMLAAGASYPGEPEKLALSNHSYGFGRGWGQDQDNGWLWRFWGDGGSDSNGEEEEFGRYSEHAEELDGIAHDLPYYLIFWASGNDRNDGPATGNSVYLTSNALSTVAYDPNIHPLGDGEWRENGYENISDEAIAKNVMSIGAVNDAVSAGSRSVASATMSGFSTWGPADDGRVKPDLVANGVNLLSPVASSDSAYSIYSGTSMATPNAMGSATLLVDYFGRLFPGHAMRASTLKGLLIHTADDLGTPGPDYQNGFGLLNAKAAADLVRAYYDQPETQIIREGYLSATKTIETLSIDSDGTSAIRVTLSWTDPKGTIKVNGDDHTPALVHDLDVRVTGPDGATHFPYVLPFALDETNLRSAAAVQQENDVDNVEVVDIPTPVAGAYTITVDYDGSLTGFPAKQVYSLLVSGHSGSAAPITPIVDSLAPLTTGAARISGSGFLLGANVSLQKDGTTVSGRGLQINPDRIDFLYDDSIVTTLGEWTAIVTNPISALTNPIMTLSTTELAYTTSVGNPVPEKSFNIENTGADSFTYSISSDSAWLTVSPTSGSTSASPDTITVSVDATDLTSGEHVGTLTISSDEAANAPRTVTYTLQLLPTIPEALDNGSLTYTNDSTYPWAPVILQGATGNDALASPAIGNNTSTGFSVNAPGPGLLLFDWKVESETDFDFLRVYLNGTPLYQISGVNQSWETKAVSLQEGPNTVEWRYEKDSYMTEGEDRGWIDNLRYLFGQNPQNEILVEGFNQGGYGSIWATEIVADVGAKAAPALSIVTSSTNPTGFSPVEGDGFLRFNSFVCDSGDAIRLKTLEPIQTENHDFLTLSLSWTRDNEYPADDTLQVQWSTDGSTWQDLGSPFTRYRGNGSDEWLSYVLALPEAAANQNIYLALLFTGDFGNDCHLDNLVVSGVLQNEVPTALSIDATALDEAAAIGTPVGTFSTTDPDAGDTHTYSLVAGSGDTDNAAFTIDGNTLLSAAVFDFETKDTYSIRVRTTDAASAFLEAELTISINDLNEAPTAPTIDATTIDETAEIGTLVGTFATTDPDAGDTHTYSLVAGSGDTDNAAFTIDGNTLLSAAVFDYETKDTYSIRVRTTDAAGAFLEAEFTISINDLNEAPTALSIDATTIDETAEIGTLVGTFATTDPDAGDTHTYSLVAGSGDTDNAAFTIDGNQLLTAGTFSAGGDLAIRVATTDSGGFSVEDTFTIRILLIATVTLSELEQVYNGSPRPVSISTAPEGLATTVTYDGLTDPPTNAGSYEVVVTITDPAYTGSTTDTLLVSKATATVTLSGLEALYDGTSHPVDVTTDPDGIQTTVTYNGSGNAPTDPGTYLVEAVVVDTNYTGEATGQLVLSAAQSVQLVSPTTIAENRVLQVPVIFTSQGTVAGLTVDLTYDATYLREPGFNWNDSLQGGSVQVDTDGSKIRILNTQPIPQILPAGPVTLGTLSFVTRSGLEGTPLQIGVTIISLSDANGYPIAEQTFIDSPPLTLSQRTLPGDANNNARLDISDSAELVRLILNPDANRPWDISLNDLSEDMALTEGDVLKILRVVAGLDPDPVFPDSTPAPASANTRDVLAIDSPMFPVVNGQPANTAPLVAWTRISDTEVLAEISLPLEEPAQSGISFSLVYPLETLRIADLSALTLSEALPENNAVWHVLPGNDFENQTGEVHFAASWSSGTLPADTALASIRFEVVGTPSTTVHYPLALTDFELAPSSSAGPAIPTPLADAATIYTRTYADWADAVFGETTALPDSDNDGDGQSNLMEYLASTDPTNPASYFAPLYAPDPQNTGFSLRVDSVYGVRYQLQSSADLLNWTPAPPVLIGDGSIIEFTLPEPVAGEKDFYRVELVP